MDPITILAALGPIAVEFGKAAIARWIAPREFRPATVEQWVQMQELQLSWFRAVSGAGGQNPSYPWVEAIVKCMRPFVAIVVMLVWADAHGFLWHAELSDTYSVDNFAAAIGFYLFGDRTLFYSNAAMRKATSQ